MFFAPLSYTLKNWPNPSMMLVGLKLSGNWVINTRTQVATIRSGWYGFDWYNAPLSGFPVAIINSEKGLL